jgi:hypothetical protein
MPPGRTVAIFRQFQYSLSYDGLGLPNGAVQRDTVVGSGNRRRKSTRARPRHALHRLNGEIDSNEQPARQPFQLYRRLTRA